MSEKGSGGEITREVHTEMVQRIARLEEWRDSHEEKCRMDRDDARDSRTKMHEKMDGLTDKITGVLVNQEGLLVKVAFFCTLAYIAGSCLLAGLLKVGFRV